MSDETKTTALANVQPPQVPARILVESNIAILDTGKFDQMWRVAGAMSQMSVVPVHLQGNQANCFLVVNQAIRWGMDVFAVAQATSVIGGRLCYEGKLVFAAIQSKLGIRLNWTYEGDEETLERKITIFGKFTDEDERREISGRVRSWRTTRNGSPWTNQADWDRMLVYRGSREWARLHAPEVILGVYTPDEFDRDFDVPLPEPLSAGNRDPEDDVVRQYKALQAAKADEAPGTPEDKPKRRKTAEPAAKAEMETIIEQLGTVSQEVHSDDPQPADAASDMLPSGSEDNSKDGSNSNGEMDGAGQDVTNDASLFDADETEETAMPEDHPLFAFWQVLGEYPEWSVIKSQLIAVCRGDYWKTIDAEQQGQIRASVWGIAEKAPTKISHLDEPTAFSCWMYTQTKTPEIEKEYDKLKAKPIYQNLPDQSRAALDSMVKAWIGKQKG